MLIYGLHAVMLLFWTVAGLRMAFGLLLTLYVCVLPQLLFGMIWMEMQMEKVPVKMLGLVPVVWVGHWVATKLRIVSQAKLEDGDEDVKLLGLSGE